MTIKFILTVVAVVSALSITLLATTPSIIVHAGGGNSAAPLTVFVPQQIEVSVGQSVTWDNPSTVAEPHTATFVLDNKTSTGIVSPFSILNSTQLAAIPPNSNSQPLRLPNQNDVVIAV